MCHFKMRTFENSGINLTFIETQFLDLKVLKCQLHRKKLIIFFIILDI